MKKVTLLLLITALTLTLLSAAPAQARGRYYRPFWPGVAAGIGAAIVLGSIIHASRYVAPPPAYYPPAPAPYPNSYHDRWIPGHWGERLGPYGDLERIWIPGYWEPVR
jgi:hypothetical protein